MNNKPNRRRYRIAAALLLPLIAGSATAQSYPDRPLRFIVPFAAGGSGDLLARVLAPELRTQFGQPVIVENRPGAAGQLGVDLVAKSLPDGYSVVMSSPGAVAINVHFRPLPYDPARDITGVAMLATIPMALAVNSQVPVHSVQDFVAYARANPGKTSYSVSGVGASTHLAGALLAHMTGVSITAVPYSGSRPATTAIASGHVQAGFSDLATLRPLGDQVRILAVVDARRSITAPSIPTIAESGIPGYEASGWLALFAHVATPKEIVARLNTEIQRALGVPAVRDMMLKSGMEPAPAGVAETVRFHHNEIAKWGKLIKDAGIRME